MRITKKIMPKKIRYLVMVLLAALLASSVYGLYYVYTTPAEIEVKVPTYSFNHKGELSYRVMLKPNSIFPEPYLGPGKTYYTKIVEDIIVNLTYQYKGDKDASSIKSAYEVVAVIEEPETWKKNFVLVPFTEVYGKGKDLGFHEEFHISPTYYNEFLKAVNDEFGVGVKEPKINIKANIYTKAESPEGIARGDMTPSMIIPLSTGTFKVDGELSLTRDGSIEKTEAVPNQVIKKLKDRQIMLMFVPILLSVTLVFFAMLTGSRAVGIDLRKKLIDTVNKKYGDRMVTVGESFIAPDKSAVIELSSMDDLARVADEMGKPIFKRDNGDKLPSYYVFDGSTVFRHILVYDTTQDSKHERKSITSTVTEQC